jgi:hypothetical protein
MKRLLIGSALAAIIGLYASQASAVAITTHNWVLQIDDSTSDLKTFVYEDGSLYQPEGDCMTVASNENCGQGAGFYVSSPTAATNFTTNFVLFETDGVTVSDFGTATAFFESDGSLQDFSLSLNSGSAAYPLSNPFSAPYESLIETGDWQTVASFSNVVDTTGAFNNVLFQIRSDDPVPEPLTLSLFGAGLAGVVAMRRRKKAKF